MSGENLVVEKLVQKEDLLPSLIRSLEDCNEVPKKVEKLQFAMSFLEFFDANDVEEELLKYVMPTIAKTMAQLYENNKKLASSQSEHALNSLKNNLEVAMTLLQLSKQMMEQMLKWDHLDYAQITSFPLNLLSLLLATFQHCKLNQERYQSLLKSNTEIISLFRKAQEIHSLFLNLSDNIQFNEEVEALIGVLDNISKIGEYLSRINTKSMADSWKSFSALIEKYGVLLAQESYDLSPTLRTITNEIEYNMNIVTELASKDLRKSSQSLKLVIYLMKIVLKLADSYPEAFYCNGFEAGLNFCNTINSYSYGYFQFYNFPKEFLENVDVYFSTNASIMEKILTKEAFLQKLYVLDANYPKTYGFVRLLSEFLKLIPGFPGNNYEIVPIIKLIFLGSKKCFTEFLLVYNSQFYEDLIVYISVSALKFPEYYGELEEVLLENVAQDQFWTAMLAIDVWCLILKNAPVELAKATLNSLLLKIGNLDLGIFSRTPNSLYLKTLVQCILVTLPSKIINEEIMSYKPLNPVWRILNFGNIPQSHHLIEQILEVFSEKVNVLERDKCSLNDALTAVELIENISTINFPHIQIKTRFSPNVNRLWTIDSSKLNPNNHFAKYFLSALTKLAIAFSADLNEDSFLVIFRKLKQFLQDPLFKLLLCDLLKSISSRNFVRYTQRNALYLLIVENFQVLLSDSNAIVVQMALLAYKQFVENNHEPIIKATPHISRLLSDFAPEKALAWNFEEKFYRTIAELQFRHDCLEWEPNLGIPPSKKIKLMESYEKENVTDEIDEVLQELKCNVQKLTKFRIKSNLDSKQISELKTIIKRLQLNVHS